MSGYTLEIGETFSPRDTSSTLQHLLLFLSFERDVTSFDLKRMFWSSLRSIPRYYSRISSLSLSTRGLQNTASLDLLNTAAIQAPVPPILWDWTRNWSFRSHWRRMNPQHGIKITSVSTPDTLPTLNTSLKTHSLSSGLVLLVLLSLSPRSVDTVTSVLLCPSNLIPLPTIVYSSTLRLSGS
jgi:hypothetical protein